MGARGQLTGASLGRVDLGRRCSLGFSHLRHVCPLTCYPTEKKVNKRKADK